MAILSAKARSSAAGQLHNALAKHYENPFLVLDLPVGTASGEIERHGQKLLAMLGAGLGEAKTYRTPFGARERTAELVRAAMAELRDPSRRLVHEYWATGWGTGT